MLRSGSGLTSGKDEHCRGSEVCFAHWDVYHFAVDRFPSPLLQQQCLWKLGDTCPTLPRKSTTDPLAVHHDGGQLDNS